MKPNVLAIIERAQRLLRRPALPDLSNSIGIAKLRYIQSIYEMAEYQNPDTLICDFLPPPTRWLSLLQGRIQLSKLRSRPFYYYLIARTRHYDHLFTDAVRGDVTHIINVGCGSDTRAYRFADELRTRNKKVLECDQRYLISIKQLLARKKWPTDHVEYVSIDINDEYWAELETVLAPIRTPVLVMLEGVSPYIGEHSFRRFLEFIASKTSPGSRLAYDYKICGIGNESDKLGCANRPFRLPAIEAEVAAYHEPLGYRLEHMELSSELMSRLLPGLTSAEIDLFPEDCLLELTVVQR